MLKSMAIGKRLMLAFASLLVFMIVTAAVGYWGLEATAALARRVIAVDAALVEHSQRARHVGIVEGDLERAVAARCVGDRDARFTPLRTLQLSPPAVGR